MSLIYEATLPQGVLEKRWSITRTEKARRRAYELEACACSLGSKTRGEEGWRHVVGFEGFYRVSNRGRIFKVWHVTLGGGGGIMRAFQRSDGYRLVSLCSARRNSRQFYIHRLVADAFIANPQGKQHINHLDFNTGNNRSDNLQWVTAAENVEHSRKAGRYPLPPSLLGETNPRAKLTDDKVRLIRDDIAAGLINSEIGRRFGVSGAAIYLIRIGKSWSHVL